MEIIQEGCPARPPLRLSTLLFQFSEGRYLQPKTIILPKAGARMGCSINATKKCKPPWWLNMLPFLKKPNHQQSQNACEEQEMQSCLEVARSKCFSYAKETCEGGLSDIRVICSEPFMNTKQHRYRRSKRSSKEEAVRLADERGPSKQSKE